MSNFAKTECNTQTIINVTNLFLTLIYESIVIHNMTSIFIIDESIKGKMKSFMIWGF